MVRIAVRDGRELRHAVALLHHDLEPLGALFLNLGAEGRGARHDQLEGRQVKLFDDGLLGQRNHNRRHNVRHGHAVLLHDGEVL